MMQFTYRAINGEGLEISGAVEAADLSAAERAIFALGLRPFETRAGTPSTSWLNREIGGGTSRTDRVRFARMLASLLAAGVPIDKALTLMAEDRASRRLKVIARIAAETIVAGQPLSAAMAKAELGFSTAETGLVRAGEQTGKLPEALLSLATELERRQALRERIVSALVYPAILFAMAIASLVLIATVLAPSLNPVFAQAGREPPVLLKTVGFVAEHLRWVAGFVGAVGMLWIVLRINGTHVMPEDLKLAFAPLKHLEAARFCRTLGNLLGQGTNLQTAIRLSRDALRYSSSRVAADKVHEQVVTGAGLAVAADEFVFLDSSTRQLIRIGEETNQLPAMLAYAATSFETLATQRIERLMTLLTPVLTIVIGGMIGGLIMSVMRAIFSLNDLALQ
jgi:general secretion pathway protein F